MKDILSSIESTRKWLTSFSGTIEEAVSDLCARAIDIDKEIHALATFEKNRVVSRISRMTDGERAASLAGVPVAVKGNICIKGDLATCSSRILEGFRAPYNAHVIDLLLGEGAALFSGMNMDEFAFGSSCETSCYGVTRNPWDVSRIPGGSSGGSAAAVASGEVPCALGSDTGGSIRQPASLCGVVGMKPTYGRVSRYGLIAFASSLDQIGPITRNVRDCARILEIIAGYDRKDSTSVDCAVPRYTESLDKDISGMTIGVPAEYLGEGISADVKRCIDESIAVLRSLGCRVVDISLPHTKYAVSCYYIIAPAEASSNLARYDGVHYGYRSAKAEDIIGMYTNSRNEGFGDEVKRRILLGTYSLSSGYYEAYYLKAQKVRTRIAGDFRKAFEECDCIITPTSPTTAFRIGERLDDPLTMYLSDICTIPANLAGLPAISIPCGKGDDGLPVGMQIMAKPFAEETVIKLAHAFERSTEHSKQVPANLR